MLKIKKELIINKVKVYNCDVLSYQMKKLKINYEWQEKSEEKWERIIKAFKTEMTDVCETENWSDKISKTFFNKLF